jgi:4-hydroxy-3-polyprenylbenzoate decarboxylase
MAYYKDLRQYLEALDQQGKLTRIKREINKDTQLHSLARLQFRGLPDDERTAFLFENVVDSKGRKYESPVATAALAGSSQVYAIGMMCKPEEISEKLAQAQLNPIEPSLVNDGPVHEEVHLGDKLLEHGGLSEFPIPLTTPGYDASPYITAGCIVTKDPETGVPNIGLYRAQLKSPTRTGIAWMENQGGLYHWHKCREMGKPLELAITIGSPPNIAYVAVSKLPFGVSELAVAGGIAGEPVKVVKCKTVDLEVPATAEIVIEGEVSTTELEPEAPFGEAGGFVGLSGMRPYFTVKCITHRKKPIWVASVSQYPPSESSKIRQYATEGVVLKHLRYDLNMQHVLAVAVYDAIGSFGFIAVKLKKTEPAEIWRTLEAAANSFPSAKIVVAVDEDVNIRDIDPVNLAICARTQPQYYRTIKMPVMSTKDPYMASPDKLLTGPGKKQDNQPTEAETNEVSCILIDATSKQPLPPLSLPKKEFMDEALRIWQEEGLPKLQLKEPWWGINLGAWNEECEELAKAAVEGDCYKAGELYSQGRRSIG